MNPNQELDTLIADIRESWPQVKNLPGQLETLSHDVRTLRRSALQPGPTSPRPHGRVSDRCAEALAYQFVVQCERKDLLGALADSPLTRDALLSRACDFFGFQKTALTTNDIPLPSEFSGEIRSLISEFGVARRVMSPFPIGRGTARPGRVGTRPAFAPIAMSAAIAEKSPTITYASLESHKVGGLVRLPREIDEQSVVNMGQFLARYGALEFARAEDTFAFLADGTTTYESIKGVSQIAQDNDCLVQFAVEINPIAKIAYGLYKGGFLNAVSVGFRPIKWEYGSPDTGFTVRYTQSELLEVSAVAIPANPEALALGLKAGAVSQEDIATLAEFTASIVALRSLGQQPPAPEVAFLRSLRQLIHP